MHLPVRPVAGASPIVLLVLRPMPGHGRARPRSLARQTRGIPGCFSHEGWRRSRLARAIRPGVAEGGGRHGLSDKYEELATADAARGGDYGQVLAAVLVGGAVD